MRKDRIGQYLGVLLILTMVCTAGAEQLSDRPGERPVPGKTLGRPVGIAGAWVDPMMEDDGFTWMHRVKLLGGDLSLSQMAALGSAPQGGSILAMTGGPDGKIYLGTDGAFLSVFDPTTGGFADLGMPVPDECFG